MKKTMQKQKWEYSRKIHINRKHKDVLFRIIFRSKKDLLDLYNAVNHTAYDNPEDLQITTMQDAVYVGIKNDLSFLIANVLNLYEHQSTYNPNMPLCGLLYFADMLRAYVEENDLNIYGSKLLNINLGHNRELMEHCIEQGKLADILIKNRSEVINMLFTKYDKKWHMGVIRKEAREEGYEEGHEAGLSSGTDRANQLNQKLLEDNRTEDLKRSVRDKAFQEQLFKEYGI